MKRLQQMRFRFTPTCVGTAPRTRRHARHPPVHPHVRGDGARPPRCCESVCGSPPRAWGRHISALDPRRDGRFTPTCVGTAMCGWLPRTRPAVHPHVRGDGNGVSAWPFSRHGSPPRAWGRRLATSRSTCRVRFTPTCVGTAASCAVALRAAPVHPHVRGDGFLTPHIAAPGAGSPPRAWGRRHPTAEQPDGRTVHPHVRGDGPCASAGVPDERGSPPRAWGRRQRDLSRGQDRRFTPTCVGTARARTGWAS